MDEIEVWFRSTKERKKKVFLSELSPLEIRPGFHVFFSSSFILSFFSIIFIA